MPQIRPYELFASRCVRPLEPIWTNPTFLNVAALSRLVTLPLWQTIPPTGLDAGFKDMAFLSRPLVVKTASCGFKSRKEPSDWTLCELKTPKERYRTMRTLQSTARKASQS